MNINPNTILPRDNTNNRSRLRQKVTPGTCHMLADGRILTTAEARRALLKRFWNETKDKTSGCTVRHAPNA